MKFTLRGLAKGTGKAAAIYLAVELLAGAILLLLALFHFIGKGHAHSLCQPPRLENFSNSLIPLVKNIGLGCR